MSSKRIDGVRIVGIASAVPETIVTLEDDAKRFGEDEMRRVFKNIGVRQRHVALQLCASDLAKAATQRLLQEIDWDPLSVDVLVYVSQCPDYPAPATACFMQMRLGLGTHCAAFDVNLGCSGYTYGLWLAASLLGGGMKRALVVVGDTASRATSPYDRAVVPLFGDAASATALEVKDGAARMDFILGTDGRGARHLHSRGGGYRHRWSPASQELKLGDDGVMRSDEHTYMNGAEVLTFAINEVPKLVNGIRTQREWSEEDVDSYVFHQASTFMLKTVSRLAKLPIGKVVIQLENYGNTSVASIPLAISAGLSQALTAKTQKLVMVGFGIGWSWAAAAIECGPIAMPDIVVVPDVFVEPEF